jgi:hypothetical protein
MLIPRIVAITTPLAATELDVNTFTQGSIAIATLGALVWAVSKIGTVGERLWIQISNSQKAQMDATIASLSAILNDNRKAEQARTDATITVLKSQIDLLAETTKAQMAAIGTMVKGSQDMRESVHGVRNAANELVAAKMLVERGMDPKPSVRESGG